MSVPESESPRGPAITWYLAAGILAGLGLIGKAPLLAKVGHLPGAAALLIAALFPLVPLLWAFGWRFRRVLGAAVVVILFAIFFTVLRTGVLHKLGRGSDQGDCVVVAAQQMAHAQWPYIASKMPTKNAMSCGPGWVALQVPAIRVGGYFADQLLLWLVALFVLYRTVPREELAGFLALLGLSAGTWLSAADGNDFLPFGLLLAVVYVVLMRWDAATLSRGALAGIVVLLFCLAQFRVPTIFLPLFFLRRLGTRAAMGTFVAAVLGQLIFLLWDTPRFVVQGPMHVGMKLFRTGIGQSRVVVSAEFLIPVLVGAVCVFWIARRFSNTATLLLTYLGLLFALPAVQNFFLQYHNKGGVLRAFGYWEGGNWIMGLLPLAAMQLALALDRRSPLSIRGEDVVLDPSASSSPRLAV